MSINFYSLGTGMLKGIEEQNERRYKMIEDMVPLMQFFARYFGTQSCNLKCCCLVSFCCSMSFLATCVLPILHNDLKGSGRGCAGFNSVVQQAKPVKCNAFIHSLIECNLKCCFLVCFDVEISFWPLVFYQLFHNDLKGSRSRWWGL